MEEPGKDCKLNAREATLINRDELWEMRRADENVERSGTHVHPPLHPSIEHTVFCPNLPTRLSTLSQIYAHCVTIFVLKWQLLVLQSNWIAEILWQFHQTAFIPVNTKQELNHTTVMVIFGVLLGFGNCGRRNKGSAISGICVLFMWSVASQLFRDS